MNFQPSEEAMTRPSRWALEAQDYLRRRNCEEQLRALEERNAFNRFAVARRAFSWGFACGAVITAAFCCAYVFLTR